MWFIFRESIRYCIFGCESYNDIPQIIDAWLQYLFYIGIVCKPAVCFAYRQLSFHCHVDVDGMGVNVGDAQELNPEEHNRFKTHWHTKVGLSLVFGCNAVCDMSREFEFICLHSGLSSVFFVCVISMCMYAGQCIYMFWCVFVWTLAHQLISHTDRHQRRFELTLRVRAALRGIRNFTLQPLQLHQTYLAQFILIWTDGVMPCTQSPSFAERR